MKEFEPKKEVNDTDASVGSGVVIVTVTGWELYGFILEGDEEGGISLGKVKVNLF